MWNIGIRFAIQSLLEFAIQSLNLEIQLELKQMDNELNCK